MRYGNCKLYKCCARVALLTSWQNILSETWHVHLYRVRGPPCVCAVIIEVNDAFAGIKMRSFVLLFANSKLEQSKYICVGSRLVTPHIAHHIRTNNNTYIYLMDKKRYSRNVFAFDKNKYFSTELFIS